MRRVNMLSTISPMLQARITRLKHNPGQHWIVVIDKDANGFTVDEAIQVLAWIGPDKANKRIRLSNLCTISNVMWFFEIIPKYFPACSSWEATNDDHRIIASSSEVYQTPPRSRTSHSSGSDENWYCWHSRTAHDSRMTALELTNIGLVLEWTDVFKREIKTVVWDWTGSEASVSQAVLSTPVELLKSNGNQGLDKQRRIEKEIILTYMRGYLDETDENNKPNINNIKLTKKDLNSHRMPLESTRFPQPSIYNMMKEIQTAILKPRRASGQVPPVPRTLNPNRPTTSGILGKIKKVEHDVELWFHGGEAHRRFVEKMLEDVHNFIERKQAELANSMLRWHETEVWKMDK
ncbi:hypothetical protein B0H63DRAFT_459425 [Podospora didyma]|uniref:Uncharacterized protein n=1 Tax=Podospora didyma TaxID=330526 RepID=A0AAE0P6I1_9PEZI|nr:hypothetical protein B0H63DRAFT_459425 [Podospora didyma]